jgi:hypothetical protein
MRSIKLYNIWNLLQLKIDGDTMTATEFVSTFQDSLGCLRQAKASLADDMDTLCALISVVIVDDSFNTVCAKINNEDLSIDEIFRLICRRESNLQLSYGMMLTGDCTTTSIATRHHPVGNSHSSQGKPNGSNKSVTFNSKVPGFAPHFPKSY